MRKVLLAAVMMMAVSGSALAEDFPQWEVFGGYSLLNMDMNPTSNLYYMEYGGFMGDMESDFIPGFEISATRNLNRWLGVEGSFSGHLGTFNSKTTDDYTHVYGASTETGTFSTSVAADVRRYTVLAGPQFSFRKNSVVRPFAHALFGIARITPQDMAISESDQWVDSLEGPGSYTSNLTTKLKGNTGFAMALGGGLDLKAGDNVAVRLVQLDYLPTYTRMGGTYTDEDGDIGPFNFGTSRFNNMKLSFGVVFTF